MINRFKSIIYSLLPKRCAYCGNVISSNSLICYKCERSLPRISGAVCNKCGREKKICSCKGAEMYFESVAAPFYFEGNVRKGLHTFKFRNSPDNAKAYCIEMADTIKKRFQNAKFDFITEVPISEDSIRDRGYNQCALLAKGVSDLCGIDYKPDFFIKLYDTEKQHGLPYYRRKGNLAGVFDVAEPDYVKGKTILICDDVSTSGETLNECAKMLWLYDAEAVYCVACALTKPKKKDKSKERK